MAIRVKKLARELRTTPEAVITALAELGYARYRSPMDMVPDTPADKLRKRARKTGLPPAGAPAPRPAAPAPPRPPPRPPKGDIMASVVPGAVPAPDSALDVPLEALAAGVEPARPAQPTADAEAFRAEERRLQARSQALAERMRELQAEQDRIEQERASIAAERDRALGELEELRVQLDARAAALDALQTGGTPLADLLHERGLKGADEQGRALDALARARLLDPLLARLRVIDPTPISRLFADRLVLTGGEAEPVSGVAMVQVPAERAEVPGRKDLDRIRADLAGEFLLSGLKRVRVVGGGPVLLRLLRGGLDPRVSLDLVPARSRTDGDTRGDLADVDALVLWDVEESARAREAYDAAAVEVIRAGGSGGLPGLLQTVRDALKPD